MSFETRFPKGRMFTFGDALRVPFSRLLYHQAVLYRTGLLRSYGAVLPPFDYQVEHLYVYQPLPFVRKMYYLDVPLYQRMRSQKTGEREADIDSRQALRHIEICRRMLEAHNIRAVLRAQKKLGRYMLHHLSMMLSLASAERSLCDNVEVQESFRSLWAMLRRKEPTLYRLLRYRSLPSFTRGSSRPEKRLSGSVYRLVRRVYHAH